MSITPVAWGRPVRRRVPALASALMMVLASNGCSNNSSPTTPSTTTPATTTYRERFTSTLPVGGSQFFSFSIATAGTVTATLESIGGPGVPSSVVVNLGVGTPYQTTCSATPAQVQVTGDAGLTAVVTGSQQPGALCVLVSDPGNLFAPATYTVVIDHP
jgi:hypothetical protein